MGSLPEPKDLKNVAELVDDLRRGDLQIVAAFDLHIETRPAAGAEEKTSLQLDHLIRKIAAAARPNRPHIVMVFEARPSREALERTIQELREALEESAHPTEGWPSTAIADRFEASRILVPEDLAPDAPDDDEVRETQAGFYPRTRYGSKL